MSSNPSEVATELQFLVTRNALLSASFASLAGPPLYFLSLLRMKSPGYAYTRLLRASFVTPILGAAAGGAYTYATLPKNKPALDTLIAAQVTDPAVVERQDYNIIGAVIGALLFSAVAKKRANIINRALGGASIGFGSGAAYHYYKSFMKPKTTTTVPPIL